MRRPLSRAFSKFNTNETALEIGYSIKDELPSLVRVLLRIHTLIYLDLEEFNI
jgi:hypothetical protein